MQQIMLRRHMGHNCCCSSLSLSDAIIYTCRNSTNADEDEACFTSVSQFEVEEEETTVGSGVGVHPHHPQAIGILDEVYRHRRSLRNSRPLTARARLTTTSKSTSSTSHRPRPTAPVLLEPSESSRAAAAAARRTYVDPEMKKRQQQEIVVSGLNINTSDISSSTEEEEEEESEVIDEQLQLFQDETLISLVEPTVRKVGGGGAVSLSAFQVST